MIIGKKINSGAGKINQLNPAPPNTAINIKPNMPIIIAQEESFKGWKLQLLKFEYKV